MNFDLNTTL
ncbi:hypothetical protein YPPY53_3612, partial [Yersinia pestis PY-53]